jgi:4-hydroxybenzoate polyprenyltransferase
VPIQVRPTARGLLLACHPVPTAGVTVLSAGLTAVAGVGLGRAVLLVAAVFAGQLSIGWSNDRIDARRDEVAGRRDKPVATGAVPPRTVGIAALVAVVVSAALSLSLGRYAGGAAFAIVICGWAYNLGLKATILSWLPYAVAFGLLPAASTLALAGHPWPGAWATVAGALLGVSAHLANVLPDLEDDAATGVRGFPHRIGARWSAVTGAALLFAAVLDIVIGAHTGVAGWVVVVLTGGAAAWAAAYAWSHRPNRAYFLAILATAAAVLVLFAVSGSSLS